MIRHRIARSVLIGLGLGLGVVGIVGAQINVSAPPTSAAGGGIGDLELRDPAQLASESLTNGVLTSGTSWTATADFALAANAATYTHSAGSGSFQQTSAAGAIPWASAGINGWFSFTYTTSAVTGAPVCTIPSTFALTAQDLNEDAGTYTLVFQAMATTVGDFKISCTSGAAATITFDTLSLKQINGGDLTVQGRVLVAEGSAALPTIASVAFPNLGIFFDEVNQRVTTSAGGTAQWSVNASTLFPNTTDADDIGASVFHVANVFTSRSIQGGKVKALTAATPTTFVTVACPQTAGANFCGGEVIYQVYETDTVDSTVLVGRAKFNCANKGGTETCAAIADVQTAIVTTQGADTLTCAITAVTGLSDVIGLAANCTDGGSMTETTFEIRYRLDMPIANTVTPG